MIWKILLAVLIAIIGGVGYNGYLEDKCAEYDDDDVLRKKIQLEYMKMRVAEEHRKYVQKMEEIRKNKGSEESTL